MSETLTRTMGSGPAEGRNGSFFGITYAPSKNDKITDFTSPGTFTPDPSNSPGAAEVFLFGGGGGGNSGIAGVCYGGGGGSGTCNDGNGVISTTFSSPASVTVGGAGSASSIGALSEAGGNGGGGCNGGNNADYSAGNGPGPGYAGGGGAGSTANGYPGSNPSDTDRRGKGGDGTDCTPFNIASSGSNYIFAGGGGSMRGSYNAGQGANTGSGGNGGGEGGGNAGYPGRVMVKEAGAGPLENTTGVWPLQSQYTYKKEGNWS